MNGCIMRIDEIVILEKSFKEKEFICCLDLDKTYVFYGLIEHIIQFDFNGITLPYM